MRDYVAPKTCQKCPRLFTFIDGHRHTHPHWYNGAVPSFGSIDAEILIVGLAPGLRGANATGRPFTGDFAGDTLYDALGKFGFTTGTYDKRADDGLGLVNLRITNAVKCVPPQNKPTGEEINTCRDAYLIDEITKMKQLRIILALGTIAHKALIKTYGLRQADHPFGHFRTHQLNKTVQLLDSYHCSRYNVQTNRLTTQMFDEVISHLRSMTS